jgi:hypothetical protein
MDLGGWLRSLGFERYEAAFRDNAIDETALPDVTGSGSGDASRPPQDQGPQMAVGPDGG